MTSNNFGSMQVPVQFATASSVYFFNVTRGMQENKKKENNKNITNKLNKKQKQTEENALQLILFCLVDCENQCSDSGVCVYPTVDG